MALTVAVLLVAVAAFGDTFAVPLAADNTADLAASSTGASAVSSSSDFSSMGVTSSTLTSPVSDTTSSSIPGTVTTATTSKVTLFQSTPTTSTSQKSAITSSSVLSPSLGNSTNYTSPSALAPYISFGTMDLTSSAGQSTTTTSTAVSTTPTSSTEMFTSTSNSPSSESITTVVSTVYLSATTVTTTAPVQTVTDTITVVPPPAPSSTLKESAWSAPPQMTDLSAFNIKNFAYGQQNMRIIVSDPPPDTLSSESTKLESPGMLSEAVIAIASAVTAGNIPPPPPHASSSFLQLQYPANSINPSQEPQGGADFYAQPMDLSKAKNVSLEYSVFFPSDFNWVEGGKLPGMYGGHEGCSGGDDAKACFSTRLMWRGGGNGELYLYAPKDKQTPALCSTPPESVCYSVYGLSIGRGSFKFAAGNWTHVKQTVVLNTPGEHDGGFVLEVGGKRVIDRSDVFYRDAPLSTSEDPSAEDAVPYALLATGAPPVQREFAAEGRPCYPKADSVLTDARNSSGDFTPWPAHPLSYSPQTAKQDFTPAFAPPYDNGTPPGAGVADFAAPASLAVPPVDVASVRTTATTLLTTVTVSTTRTVTVVPTSTQTTYVVAMESGVPAPALAFAAREPIGFKGLFFSTFFGGHESRFATPKDQFTWFKDFSMTINA